MKILIAYDGSAGANDALDDLQRAGLPPEAEALVISVDELWGLWPSGDNDETEITESHSGALGEIRAMTGQACERLRALFPAWTVLAEARAGSPARMLILRADEWQADLIVAGAQGRQSAGQAMLGSVSQQLATEAHCTIRIGRRRAADDSSPPRIIIGMDGSPNSQTAARLVAARYWPRGTRVRLITAILRAPVLTESHPWREWYYAEEILKAAEAQLQSAGVSISSAIEEGDPRRVLLDAAEEWEADSIFVGATSLHRVARFLLGSVPTSLTARASCSVEVVRSGAESTARRDE